MNREFRDGFYTTTFVEDREDGYAGLELQRLRRGSKECIAKIIFWDACGQFSVETFGAEIPLEILEEFIVETRKTIKTG
jgi:hypothetical protein